MALRLAIWGTFDVDNYGDHLFPRVAAHELARRLPGAVLDAYSPYGWLKPSPLDDGERPVSPLGAWSPERAREFAADYDLVLVGGGEIIHLNDPLLAAVYDAPVAELERLAPSRWFVEGLGSEAERFCPVVWHGVGVPGALGPRPAERLKLTLRDRKYVTVRDRFSKARLEAAGVTSSITIVPDSALLLDRVLPVGGLRRRLGRLRRSGHCPAGPTLVAQGCDLLVPHVPDIAAALRRWLAGPAGRRLTVCILETGRCRGDAVFAGALAEHLAPEPVYRMPAATNVEDVAAAVYGADVFVGSSLHGGVTAFVYGRPFVIVNPAGESKINGFADLAGVTGHVLDSPARLGPALDAARAAPVSAARVVALQRRVDAHFDRIAALAEESAAARPVTAGTARRNGHATVFGRTPISTAPIAPSAGVS